MAKLKTAMLAFGRWGNSYGVLIPKSIAHKVGLQVGTPVLATYKEHSLVIHVTPEHGSPEPSDSVPPASEQGE